jgi:hypothetical protein
MKFEHLIQASDYIVGTGLMGHIRTTYGDLVDTFGEPTRGYTGDGKTTVEWQLIFEDGTIATIYDYKEDLTPLDLYEWHIGGRNGSAVDRVLEVMEAKA